MYINPDNIAQETFGVQQYNEWKLQKEAQEEYVEKDAESLKSSFVANDLYGKDVVSDNPDDEKTEKSEAIEQPATNRKFELVPENVKEVDGHTLYQIRALSDIETVQV